MEGGGGAETERDRETETIRQRERDRQREPKGFKTSKLFCLAQQSTPLRPPPPPHVVCLTIVIK